MSKISGYSAIASVQTDDLLVVVDVHDPTMAPTGTTKKMTLSQLPFVPSSEVGAADGVASLDSGSKVPAAEVPQLQDYAPTGLTGATAPTAYAGGTTSGHPLSGTWSVGQWVVDQTGQIWACIAAGTPGTWRKVGANPWQFFADDYAAGDGKVISDLTIGAGNLSQATSASANFTPADTGKTIMINGALGAATPLITTITYVSATTINLAAPATQAITSANTFYHTDDTANINSAYSAAGTYALAHNYYAEVIYGAKFYGLASGPTQTTSPAVQNAQIPLPFPNVNGSTQKLVIASIGAGSNNHSDYWESVISNMAGTCLVSTVKAPASQDPTYGIQSVIGGPSGGGAFTGGFANTKAILKNIAIWAPAMTNQYGADFRYIGGANVEKCSFKAFASVNGSQPNLPSLPGNSFFQTRFSAGLYMPVSSNNADSYVDEVAVEGFSIGVGCSDTFTAGKLQVNYCSFGLYVDATLGLSGNMASITVENFCCGETAAAIHVNGGGFVPMYINLATEGILTAHVQDGGNALRGVVRWNDTGLGSPAVTGAANLEFVSDNLQPGVWSGAPAAPSSGSAQQNMAYRPATVWVTSTAAITAIAVDSSQVFSGSVASGVPLQVRVPGGHTYTVTSPGGTLTTHWILD